MKDIYYVNSAGKELDLLTSPYLLQTGALFDYKWSYENGFRKEVEEKILTLSITNYGQENYYAAIDKFYETVEYDILHETPGRLYFGRDDYYLECYISTSTKTEWESDSGLLDNEIILRVEKPFWIKETTKQFLPNNTSALAFGDAGIKKYPYSYPYVYDYTSERQELQNLHFTDCDFEMIIYGPVINPAVVIDGHIYQIDCKLDSESEHIKINSYTKTVCKVYADGTQESVYEYRNRDYYIYEPIPSGLHSVFWDGSFGFDITLIAKRSEPSWI